MKPDQADNEIEEEYLLNFVVNSLDEELAIDLSENVKVIKKRYEDLAAAAALNTFPQTAAVDAPAAAEIVKDRTVTDDGTYSIKGL